ncbi:transposase [Intestinimonas timonensis]|uniref:transposase n=1 Tax=Intestinimonas timonensis TaxID=1689270 RepID=UPI0013EEF408|nr:transposase [Intestinimonas timonensis]
MAGKKTADKAVGRTKGGWNTKLHAVVDGLGNPVEFLLSAGNDHDSVHAVELLKKVRIGGSAVLADRAYGARTIRKYISAHGASYVIPPQSNVSDPWPVDWHLYKERHLVECFFQKINSIRAKLPRNLFNRNFRIRLIADLRNIGKQGKPNRPQIFIQNFNVWVFMFQH